MLMDSVTVLLHRLGVAYKAIMNPVFRVRRGHGGELLDIVPSSEATFGDGVDETWVHVQLSSSVDRRALAEAEQLLPRVLADARQVALDSTYMAAALRGLAAELDSDTGAPVPQPRPQGRRGAAALAGRRALRAAGLSALPGARRRGDRSTCRSRLGVLRLRHDVLPQLTDKDELLALAQATIPSFLRYGAYP